jgi:hypothetical protein
MRRFYLKRHGVQHEWHYGEGTYNPQGDYYWKGMYKEAARLSLSDMLHGLKDGDAVEIYDPDLVLAAEI